MKAFIINLLVVFVIKVIDNILGTGKTILIQKNKAFIASLTVVISQIIFYKLIDAVSDSGSEIMIYVIAIASGIGTLLALMISNKFSKNRTYVNIILNDNKEVMMEFRDWLKEHKITNLTTDGYTKDWEKTLAITAYVETKEQSKLIDEFINNSEYKFKRIIQKQ
ncbi:MAG: hypothetical protein SPI44_03820 [Bacilli bacterium]|nr:hypothetical protein [Bacilli bacterium]